MWNGLGGKWVNGGEVGEVGGFEGWMSGLGAFHGTCEVKWVGYVGCLTLRVIHFEMGSCFGLGVAERTYT